MISSTKFPNNFRLHDAPLERGGSQQNPIDRKEGKVEGKTERKSPPNPRLRKAREERGWPQEKLAELINTTSVNISRWENGATFPSPYFRQKLSKVFDKTLAELGLVPTAHGARIWNVPIARNPYFTGREELLGLLRKRLSASGTAALTQALSGLGGIGKTQAAAEYAYRYSDDYAYVFWVRAASREALFADFVTIAELLDLPEKDGQDQYQIVTAVKEWLASNEGWLLILDNADDLPQTQRFLPTRRQGHILLTTRAQAFGTIAAPVEVEKLDLQAGILLLLRWTKHLDEDAPLDQVQGADREVAERLVREMDGLPLALVQAAAYVEETGCTLGDYLDLYATHRKDLLARRSRYLLDYPETVATTWSISFEQVKQQSPVAAEVLHLCAFLAPDAIPEDLLMRAITELGTESGTETLDSYKFNEAIEVLRRYSLVRRDKITHTLSIHRLVQAVLKDSMDQQTQRSWAERTVRTVNAAFPEADSVTGENQQDYLQYYVPHVQECATLIEQYHLYSTESARLLYQVGIFLYSHGFYPQSQALQQQALAIREQVCGSEHPDVAESLNALAMLARVQGNYGQAEGLHRQALAIREKALGQNHPSTAISLNNLGVVYRNQGKYELAVPLLKQALSIREQALGSEHSETMNSFINLATLYSEQHKYEQAERLLKQVLATGERVLGPEHPLVAHILNLLARLAYAQGNYKEAETLWKQSLAIIEKTLGSENPSTAERLNDLAELYVAQGHYAQALSLCERAVSICEERLGSDHLDTIAYRNHLTEIKSKLEEE